MAPAGALDTLGWRQKKGQVFQELKNYVKTFWDVLVVLLNIGLMDNLW